MTGVRALLAEVLGDPAVAGLPAGTALLSGGLGLDSVTVVRLLAAIRDRLGVDVADEDLDLDALATVGTLVDFVAAHAGNPGPAARVGAGMRIGIVGTGNIGGTLARLLAAGGHQVAVSNSRGPETLAGTVASLGSDVRALSAADAAAFGELVVVSIPTGRYLELPPEPYAGKIVVDTNNYYPQRDGHIVALDEGRATSTGLLAEHLAGSRMVKAFNTIHWKHLRDLGAAAAAARDRRAIPIAGDDAEAKAAVSGLIDAIGFTAVDTGLLVDSWRQEPGAPVYGAEVGPDEAVALIAQARR